MMFLELLQITNLLRSYENSLKLWFTEKRRAVLILSRSLENTGQTLILNVDFSWRKTYCKISLVLSSKTEVTKLRSRSSKRSPSLFRTLKIEPLYVDSGFLPYCLVFILSNNHINDLITTPLDFMDEDVVSQYISFLKLLSMNLTPDTVQFFYNYVCFWLVFSLFQTQSADPFPLFSICSKFYDHPEPMVRIAVRTITLNCLKGTTPIPWIHSYSER